MMGMCPLCGLAAELQAYGVDNAFKLTCRNCGAARIACRVPDTPREKAALSHAIRRMQSEQISPEITADILERIVANGAPSHNEMADNLLNYLAKRADNNDAIYGRFEIISEEIRAIIGCVSVGDVIATLNHLQAADLIRWEAKGKGPQVQLTFKGWDRYRELQRENVNSRAAFMAMQYGDTELDEMFDKVFAPAVAAVGYTLRRLDKNPKAGVIDNHLRVEIRNARFLLADLTHGNPGAYWEAGFAEGLGRPVLYLCKDSVFAEKRTHFDTNHCQTVRWDSSDWAGAAQQIKDAIRATLPAEAKMVD